MIKPFLLLAVLVTFSTPAFSSTLIPGQSIDIHQNEDIIFEIQQPGRYSIQSKSKTGIAFQLIDHLTGPRELAGTANKEDGRIDVFLSPGEYKIHPLNPEKTLQGQFSLHHFSEAPAATITPLKLISTTLKDLQARQYRFSLSERQQVIIEAAGQHLTDLRLWQQDHWILGYSATFSRIEPIKGQPLNVAYFSADLPAGNYQLKLYGGTGTTWTESSSQPLYLRMGIPTLNESQILSSTTSPFGIDRWKVIGNPTYFNLSLPKPSNATLKLHKFNQSRPFTKNGRTFNITKKSKKISVDAFYSNHSKATLMSVSQTPGQPFKVQNFNSQSNFYVKHNSERYWLNVLQAQISEAEPPITSMLIERRGKQSFIKAKNLINLTKNQGYKTRFNIDQNPIELILHVNISGKYLAIGSGPKATFALTPFFNAKKTPPLTGSVWDIQKGYYRLTITPKQAGFLKLTLQPSAPKHFVTTIPSHYNNVYLSKEHSYTLYTNQTGAPQGLVQRQQNKLLETPLLLQNPAETVDLKTNISTTSQLTVVADGKALPVVINQKNTSTLSPGEQTIQLKFPKNTQSALISRTTVSQPALIPTTINPPIQLATPEYLDLDKNSRKTFTLNLKQPGVYRVESTGLLKTKGTIRTLLNPKLFSKSQNGVGQNFLAQPYLLAGEYQLTVETEGLSRGHLSLSVAENPLISVPLNLRQTHFATLPAGTGIAYRVTIEQAGDYHIAVTGLNRQYQTRLEDHDGWPLMTTKKKNVTLALKPGQYTLFVNPKSVQNRIQASIYPAQKTPDTKGHGPHPLTLDLNHQHTWLEPDAGQSRTPDQWTFTLTAKSDTEIRLSEEMVGTLSAETLQKPITIYPLKTWKGALGADDYTLSVTSQRPNHQFDYQVAVNVDNLLPGQSKSLSGSKSNTTLSIDEQGTYQVYSSGPNDLKAALSLDNNNNNNNNNHVTSDDRENNWNFLLQENLAPGEYSLNIQNMENRNNNGSKIHLVKMTSQENPNTLAPGKTVTVTANHAVQTLKLNTPNTLMTLTSQANQAYRLTVHESLNTPAIATLDSTHPNSAFLPKPEQQYWLKIWPNTAHKAAIQITMQGITLRGDALTEVTETPVAPKTRLAGDTIRVSKINLTHAHHLTVNHDTPVFWLSPSKPIASEVKHGSIPGLDNTVWIVQFNPAQVLTLNKTALVTSQSLWLTKRTQLTLPPVESPRLIIATSKTHQPQLQLASTPANTGSAVQPSGFLIYQATNTSEYLKLSHSANSETNIDLQVMAINPSTTPSPLTSSSKTIRLDAHQVQSFSLGKAYHQLYQFSLPPQTAVLLFNKNTISQVLWAKDSAVNISTTGKYDAFQTINLSDSPSVLALHTKRATSTYVLSELQPYLNMATSPNLNTIKVTNKHTQVRKLLLKGNVKNAWFINEQGEVSQGTHTLDILGSGTLTIQQDIGATAAWFEGSLLNPNHNNAHLLTSALNNNRVVYSQTNQSKTAYPISIEQNSPTILSFKNKDHFYHDFYPVGISQDVLMPTGSSTLQLINLPYVKTALLQKNTDAIPLAVEGLNPFTFIAPGKTTWYQFTLAQTQDFGIGLKANNEAVKIDLYQANGKHLGSGIEQMHHLEAGHYYIALTGNISGSPTSAQLATVGINKPSNEPPESVLQRYLQLEEE
ncbi:MAG: hypothetical protein HOM11_08700 [Methylococcales bacterium]|nr:hypothetical protein [Methylococcales bacterium]